MNQQTKLELLKLSVEMTSLMIKAGEIGGGNVNIDINSPEGTLSGSNVAKVQSALFKQLSSLAAADIHTQQR